MKNKSGSQSEKVHDHVDPLSGSPVSKVPSKMARVDEKAEMDVSQSGPEGFVRAGLLVGAGAGVGSGGGVASSDIDAGVVSEERSGVAEEGKEEEEKGKGGSSGSKGDLPGIPPWPGSVSGKG